MIKIRLQVVLVILSIWAAVDSLPSDGYGKDPKGYFQYINVPGVKEYEFGWRRGNPHHSVSRFEQAKDHRFRTRVKWSDTKDGYGEHYWEYNHAPKNTYEKKDSYGHEPPLYKPQQHGYSENVEVVMPVEEVQSVYKN